MVVSAGVDQTTRRPILRALGQPLRDVVVQGASPVRSFLLDRRGDERRLLREPFQGKLAILVHPVPFASLTYDAFIVTKMQAFDDELGPLAVRFWNAARYDELERREEHLEPSVSNLERIDDLSVPHALLAGVQRTRRRSDNSTNRRPSTCLRSS